MKKFKQLMSEARQFTKKSWIEIVKRTLASHLGSEYTFDNKSVKYPGAAVPLPAFKIYKNGQPTNGYIIIKYETGQWGLESAYIGAGGGNVLEWKPTAQPSWNPKKAQIVKMIEAGMNESLDTKAIHDQVKKLDGKMMNSVITTSKGANNQANFNTDKAKAKKFAKWLDDNYGAEFDSISDNGFGTVNFKRKK